jgi:DNA-binding transcriptional LysR family regulator
MSASAGAKPVNIQCVWAYLPAFLAVAEAQHLRRAALDLRVSPSALSRSISILEHRIGHALFERSGGRMRLNALGERLHSTVRQVIQLIDGAVDNHVTSDVTQLLPRSADDFVARMLRSAELGPRSDVE